MKKSLLNTLLILILGLSITGCGGKPPQELADIQALKAETQDKISSMRSEIIKQTARALAAQAGLAWYSRQLNTMLESQKRHLDHIFNFNYLILNQNVLPPVLTEGRNILNLADDFTIRVSDHLYQIVESPRFITTPPNWRDYIWMAFRKPESPSNSLLPQNAAERKIWNEYIKIGWDEGITQAYDIFFTNLAKLQRDYEGMILYRKLLAKNMVSKPYVAEAELGITGNNSTLNINDRILRITAIPALQFESKNWHPIMTTKESLREHVVTNSKRDEIN